MKMMPLPTTVSERELRQAAVRSDESAAIRACIRGALLLGVLAGTAIATLLILLAAGSLTGLWNAPLAGVAFALYSGVRIYRAILPRGITSLRALEDALIPAAPVCGDMAPSLRRPFSCSATLIGLFLITTISAAAVPIVYTAIAVTEMVRVLFIGLHRRGGDTEPILGYAGRRLRQEWQKSVVCAGPVPCLNQRT